MCFLNYSHSCSLASLEICSNFPLSLSFLTLSVFLIHAPQLHLLSNPAKASGCALQPSQETQKSSTVYLV